MTIFNNAGDALKDANRLIRQLRAELVKSNDERDIWQDRAETAHELSATAEAAFMAEHWRKVFGAPEGYRIATPEELTAYARDIGKITGQAVAVPVNFHLTDGRFVHWTDPAYLVNCPACGVAL